MQRALVVYACVLWIVSQVLSDPAPAWSEDDIYDRFYDDDTTATLNFLPGQTNIQVHNFWLPGDADWAIFNVVSDGVYSVRVTDQASSCNAIIYLFHESNLTTPLVVRDDWGPGIADEEINWFSQTTSGTMFVKIAQSPNTPDLFGEGTTYTLRVEGTWGGNTGLAFISGTSRRYIGPPGGLLRVPESPGDTEAPSVEQEHPSKQDTPTSYVYTKHQVFFPPNALDRVYELIIGNPGDIGPAPCFDYTKNWLSESEHPGNCSIVQILTQTHITLWRPTVLTVQFVDDGPTTDGFTIDDLPDGATSSSMRIHTWTGSSWQLFAGPQSVVGDTVSAYIWSLGDVPSPTGNNRMSLFAVAPTEATADVKSWRSYR